MKDLDIKEVWKGADSTDGLAFSEQRVNEIIRKGSHNLIQKFIRALAFEKWANVVVLTLVTGYLVYWEAWVVSTGLCIVNVLVFVYYQNLNNKLKREQIDANVLQYLYNVQTLIRQFIRHYKIATVVLSPIAVAGAYHLHQIGFYGDPEEQWSFVIGLAAGMVVAIPLTFYLIHVVYGKKARKLAKMIASLENDEN